jgi:hypothetical protein
MENVVDVIPKTMRPYRLTVTDAFRNLKIEGDDIPFDVHQNDGSYYEIIINLGNGEEAALTVSEGTVERCPEYFRFVKQKKD